METKHTDHFAESHETLTDEETTLKATPKGERNQSTLGNIETPTSKTVLEKDQTVAQRLFADTEIDKKRSVSQSRAKQRSKQTRSSETSTDCSRDNDEDAEKTSMVTVKQSATTTANKHAASAASKPAAQATPTLESIPQIRCTLTGKVSIKVKPDRDSQGGEDRQQEQVQITLHDPLQYTLTGPLQCPEYSPNTPCELQSPQFTLRKSDLECVYNSIPKEPVQWPLLLQYTMEDPIICGLNGNLRCSTHRRPLKAVATPSTSRFYHATTGYVVDGAPRSCTYYDYGDAHASIKPRLLYDDVHEQGDSYAKKFENYFARGVDRAQIDQKCKIDYKATLNTVQELETGRKKRQTCQPDAVFICGFKGAIVDMKNYHSQLNKDQVRKTYWDMWALSNTHECWPEKAYIYIRELTPVSKSATVYAKQHQIEIVREGYIDADELVTLICAELRTGFLPTTRGFYLPGRPDNPIIDADYETISGKYVLPAYEEMQLWQRITRHRRVYTNYVYDNKKQCFYHSGPLITQTPRDQAMFIFTKGPN